MSVGKREGRAERRSRRWVESVETLERKEGAAIRVKTWCATRVWRGPPLEERGGDISIQMSRWLIVNEGRTNPKVVP